MIMSTVNRNTFISSFLIWMTFNFLSCLIALARTSSTILIRSGQRGHPCLAYNFRGKDFSFSILSMMLTMVLSHMALSYCSKFLLYLRAFNLLRFYHERVLNFTKYFLCIYWDDHTIFILHYSQCYLKQKEQTRRDCTIRLQNTL